MKNKNYITASQLANILGIPKSTIYFITHPEKKKKVALKKAERENRDIIKKNFNLYKEQHGEILFKRHEGNMLIEIDEFLEAHKMFNFRFVNEETGESFLKRLEKIESITLKDYSDYLTSSEIRKFLNIENYTLKKIREKKEIDYKIIEDERYPKNTKGRNQYLYSKQSIEKYMKNNNLSNNSIKNISYDFKKHFISVNEIKKYMDEIYNFKVSNLTIYRRISQTKEIPAIRVGTLIKIPILEFKLLSHKEIFRID